MSGSGEVREYKGRDCQMPWDNKTDGNDGLVGELIECVEFWYGLLVRVVLQHKEAVPRQLREGHIVTNLRKGLPSKQRTGG